MRSAPDLSPPPTLKPDAQLPTVNSLVLQLYFVQIP